MLHDLLRDPYRQSWARKENEVKLQKAMGSEDWKLFSDVIQAIGEVVALLSRDIQRILPRPVSARGCCQLEAP